MTGLAQLTAAPGANAIPYFDPAFPDRRLVLHSARPREFTPATPVLFVHHGVARNGEAYRDYWLEHVDDAGILAISIEFPEETFPEYLWYNFGNLHAKDGTPNPREEWTFGIDDRLFGALRDQGVTQRHSYGVFGHSAGGQYVHRMLSFGYRDRVAVAVSANAGTYAMPDLDIPWPFGLGEVGLTPETLAEVLEFPHHRDGRHRGHQDHRQILSQGATLPQAGCAPARACPHLCPHGAGLGRGPGHDLPMVGHRRAGRRTQRQRHVCRRRTGHRRRPARLGECMKRRTLLAAALSAPAIARAETSRVLKFIPQSDLATLDPMFTTASVTRCHGHLVFDTLYGMDNNYQANPQMAAGHAVSNNGLQWDITLRDGLLFHDGTKVLARDAVASIQRWWQRDSFGAELSSRTDEISAHDDKTIRLRLKKPFALVPDALAVIISVPVIMPERLAKTDPFKQVTEMVGSGPFRFLDKERVTGSRVVYERFAAYQPRSDGKPEFASGPKVAHFDRVEWTVIPDASTAASALASGEFDWWENPSLDLVPQLKRAKNLTVTVKDFTSANGIMRFNHLFPPFDNPAIRKVVVSAIDQTEFMQAVAGATPELVRDKVGLFVPDTPMANDAGLDIQSGPKNIPRATQGAERRGL